MLPCALQTDQIVLPEINQRFFKDARLRQALLHPNSNSHGIPGQNAVMNVLGVIEQEFDGGNSSTFVFG